MGSGFAKKKKEAKMLQAQLSQIQDQMMQAEETGVAGNGLVTLVMNGEYQLKSLVIKPECVDPEDVDGLRDLIMAAHADALRKLNEKSSSVIPQLGGGISGMGLFN